MCIWVAFSWMFCRKCEVDIKIDISSSSLSKLQLELDFLWDRIGIVRAFKVKLKIMLTYSNISSMTVVTSDSLRSVRSSEWSSASELLGASRLTRFSFFLFLQIASWHLPASCITERRLWCTWKLKCHGLKNILSWCDEYFTVGIFLVSVVSFPRTHWSTYSSWRLTDGGKATRQKSLLLAAALSPDSTLTRAWSQRRSQKQVWHSDFRWC